MTRNESNCDNDKEDLLGELRTYVEGLREEFGDVREEFSDVREEIGSLEEEIESLREEFQKLKNYPDALLSVKEAAEWLGICERKLADMADAGEIQPVRIGSRVLYRPDTLDAYTRRRMAEE